jgi:hypothetical protein
MRHCRTNLGIGRPTMHHGGSVGLAAISRGSAPSTHHSVTGLTTIDSRLMVCTHANV